MNAVGEIARDRNRRGDTVGVSDGMVIKVI
jgi:hypothetical protein